MSKAFNTIRQYSLIRFEQENRGSYLLLNKRWSVKRDVFDSPEAVMGFIAQLNPDPGSSWDLVMDHRNHIIAVFKNDENNTNENRSLRIRMVNGESCIRISVNEDGSVRLCE